MEEKLKNSPIDFYVDRVNKIANCKLSKARQEAALAYLINAIIVSLIIGILFVAFSYGYHFIVKDKRIVTEYIEKEIIVTKEVNKPIILSDGTKILRNGTIIKKDGSVISSMDNLIADITDAANYHRELGVNNYSLFVNEEVKQNNRTEIVTTGYGFELSSDERHPSSQWCFYNAGKGLSRDIASISGSYTIVKDKYLSEEDFYLTEACKWLTPKVSDHLRIVDESEIPEELKLKVTNAIELFEIHTGKSTKKIKVNYGKFDQPEDFDVLGTCFLGGTQMQISIDHLEKSSEKHVEAVVFHELGHCILGLGHADDETHIMHETINDIQINKSYVEWSDELLKMNN